MKNIVKTIGVIGFGRFGSFFANQVLPCVFPKAEIYIHSRKLTKNLTISFNKVMKTDLVIPAVPIRVMPEILTKMSSQVGENTIVMDVCSVKVMPVEWMKKILPTKTNILATHPMFGPSSPSKFDFDLSKFTIVMCPIRISQFKYKNILESFRKQLKVVEMSPVDHDKKTAKFQLFAHFLSAILHELKLKKSDIDTVSASCMLDMMEHISNDSRELLEDLYKYNPYSPRNFKKFNHIYNLFKNRILK